MNMFNRMFASVIALLWCGLLAASLLLIWQPSHSAAIDNSYLHFRLNVPVTGSDQILATIIVGALIALGVILFAAEMMPWSSSERVYERDRTGRESMANASGAAAAAAPNDRFGTLERRLDDLQRRVEANQRMISERSGQTPRQPQPVEQHRHWGIFDRARHTS